MNVTRLRIVYELSRRGSVTAVAEALWMTPSAVSQHLVPTVRRRLLAATRPGHHDLPAVRALLAAIAP